MARQPLRWPYRANHYRENAIARMIEVEKLATAGFEAAYRRRDCDEMFRLFQTTVKAMNTRYEMQLAYAEGAEGADSNT